MNAFDVLNGLLMLEHNGKSVKSFFEDNEVERVILYGMGPVGSRFYEALKAAQIQVVCAIDKNADRMQMEELPIYTPEQAGDVGARADLIVVTPMEHYYDIKEELELYTETDIISVGEIIEYCVVGETFPGVKFTKKPAKRRPVYCTVTTSEPSNRLAGRIIAVTGATSGIGREIAMKAAREGAQVIAIGRNEEKLQQLSEETGCRIYPKDICKITDYDRFFDELESVSDGTRIDSFVNNAGIYMDHGIGNYKAEDFERIIDVNLKSSFLLMQAFIMYCKRKGIAGNTVVTASNRALFGDVTPYGISKSGIVNAVMGFARETVRDNIRVNAISPGMTASGINGIDKNGDLYTDSARGRRVILPEEIAEVACWLLSDYSKCITGANIPCDMGDYLR